MVFASTYDSDDGRVRYAAKCIHLALQASSEVESDLLIETRVDELQSDQVPFACRLPYDPLTALTQFSF